MKKKYGIDDINIKMLNHAFITDFDFYLRTESIKQEDILNLSVLNENDKDIISALISPEPCLLEGSRGTGKSFLMRVAELKIESEKKNCVAVFPPMAISITVSASAMVIP